MKMDPNTITLLIRTKNSVKASSGESAKAADCNPLLPYLRLKNIHCLHGAQGIQTLAFNSVFAGTSSAVLCLLPLTNHECRFGIFGVIPFIKLQNDT